MSKTATIRTRIEPSLKHEVEDILAQLGLTASETVQLLYRQIKLQRCLPFDVRIPNALTARTLHAPGESQQAGPYRVTLDPVSVPSGEISTIDVSITKDGRPAEDLHPYLGAMAHGVFVGTKDLAYMHAHGMTAEMLDMASAADCGDSMMLSMPPMVPSAKVASRFEFEILAPSAQPYNFWMQFIGGTTLYTVPFLITGK